MSSTRLPTRIIRLPRIQPHRVLSHPAWEERKLRIDALVNRVDERVRDVGVAQRKAVEERHAPRVRRSSTFELRERDRRSEEYEGSGAERRRQG